jgi:hypothetical protein
MRRYILSACVGLTVAAGALLCAPSVGRADPDWDRRYNAYRHYWDGHHHWRDHYHQPYYRHHYHRHPTYNRHYHYRPHYHDYHDYYDHHHHGGTVRVGPLRFHWH